MSSIGSKRLVVSNWKDIAFFPLPVFLYETYRYSSSVRGENTASLPFLPKIVLGARLHSDHRVSKLGVTEQWIKTPCAEPDVSFQFLMRASLARSQ